MIYNWSISYLDKHSSTHVISVMQLNKTYYNTEQKGKEKKHIFKTKTKRGNIHSSCNRYSKVQLLKPHDYDIKSSQLVRPSIFSPRELISMLLGLVIKKRLDITTTCYLQSLGLSHQWTLLCT